MSAFRRCLRSPRVVIGGALVLAVAVAALLAPWIAPHDPQEQDLLNTLLPPAWAAGGDPAYPLGTDQLGRCVLSRLLFGARIALYVAVLAASGAMLLGTALALLAGTLGGRTDALIGRAIDVWMAFPPVILALILLVGLGAGVHKVILAIIVVDWTRFCRIVRSEVMVVVRRDYVAAARLLGFGRMRVLWREVLPAVLPLVITVMALEMGIAVVVEAIMSFVGLSVEASVPAWGVMIADARQAMFLMPWGVVFPVLGIFVTVLGFNLLGDGLRRALDNRLIVSREVVGGRA
ncbi:MAG: ABC transporter permease [Acetobacteraceae bacterium]|nr:ABC transporter permease [Acetobacteraceae bacterium]MCX7684847.1 ABC transporter permease [Acetobacteraceae bacterium]MDW8397557.1 ABC transporter permease [Acetobacteraceae bacterium]